MNKQLEIIRELINQFDAYESVTSESNLSLRVFTKWLYDREVLAKKQVVDEAEDMHLSGEIVFYLDALGKRFKSFTKKALSESQLISADEYSFLIHLAHAGSFRKLEIIKMHLLETPTGIEIIKRLLGKSLIEEFDDPDDKRAKRIKLTEKGSNELEKVQGGMMEVYQKMTGDFSGEEKIQLKSLFSALNDYHNTHE
jgi:DNA-binding MarR family transcriptional regulator